MRFDPQASYVHGDEQSVISGNSLPRATARSPLKTALAILTVGFVAGVGAWLWGEISKARAAADDTPPQANPAAASVIRFAEAVSSDNPDAYGVEEGIQTKGELSRLRSKMSPRHRRGKVREAFEAGQTSMAVGRHAEAVTHFAAAVKLDPQFAEAHYRLGLAYVHTGDMRKARQELKELRTLDPDMANLLDLLID